MNRQGPFLGRLVNRHVEGLTSGLLVGIDLAVSCELVNDAVDRFDSVSGINRFSNRRWKIESRDDVLLLGSLHHCNRRILLVPHSSKIIECVFDFDNGRSLVYFLEVSNHGLAILGAHVTLSSTYQIHVASLYPHLGIGRVNCFGETGQASDPFRKMIHDNWHPPRPGPPWRQSKR